MLRFALALVLCCGCASTPRESVFIPDPNSGLVVGYAADQPGYGTIVEYVPAGETVEAWEHLLTIQFLEDERSDLGTWLASREAFLRKQGGTLEWRVLEQDALSMLYEWSMRDNPKEGAIYRDQVEIARLLRGNDGLHRIAYAERGRTMDPERREHYLAAFRAAYVVKGEDRQRVEVRP